MNTTARGYDHFKLIVAVILLLIFLCIFLWTPVKAPGVPRQVLTDTGVPPTGTTASVSTDTSIPPTVTVTEEPIPTETATVTPAPPTPTSTPEPPTQTPTPTATIVEIPTSQDACEMVAPSRLKPGMKAITKVRLNFRQSAGIGKNLITTMLPETRVEIIGGPTCLKYIKGAYLWWKIKIPGGQIGWSAEASINGGYYFLEPVK